MIRERATNVYFMTQGDGNLVLVGNWKAQWDTKTSGKDGQNFVMQDDGNAVLYTGSGNPIWSTGVSRAVCVF